MKKYIYFLLLSLFFISGIAQAQKAEIKCRNRFLLIKKFENDSMSTYQNRYVGYGVLKSIKESKFPVEIRMYTSSISSEIVDLKILQATSDSVYITQKKIWIAGKTGINMYERVYTGDNFTVNVATFSKKDKNDFCDFFSNLISNHIFDLKGSDRNAKFINEDKGIFDGHSSSWFEIKISDNFRNFEYHSDANLKDPDQQRAKYIDNIREILYNKLNLR